MNLYCLLPSPFKRMFLYPLCNVKNQRIVLSDNSYRWCLKCQHSFSQQNLTDCISGSHACSFSSNMYSKMEKAQMTGPASEGESCWRRIPQKKKENEDGTQHFILHPFKNLIWLFTHCGSWKVVSLPEIQNIKLVWVHMTSLTNIKPPCSYTQLVALAHKQHGGTLCLQATLFQPNIVHPAFRCDLTPNMWPTWVLIIWCSPALSFINNASIVLQHHHLYNISCKHATKHVFFGE